METWISTYSGKVFDVFRPDPEQIDIIDIAVALSRMPRFAGHTTEFYSVAQHSIHVAELCGPSVKLAALLHDASEAYLVDLPRPIKHAMPEYIAIEALVMRAIADKFGFDFPLSPCVKEADNVMLETEHRDLQPGVQWSVEFATAREAKIEVMDMLTAQEQFLDFFYSLQEDRPLLAKCC